MQKNKKAIKRQQKKINGRVQTKWLKVGPDIVLAHGTVLYNNMGWLVFLGLQIAILLTPCLKKHKKR